MIKQHLAQIGRTGGPTEYLSPIRAVIRFEACEGCSGGMVARLQNQFHVPTRLHTLFQISMRLPKTDKHERDATKPFSDLHEASKHVSH
jgi:hypothetical protein